MEKVNHAFEKVKMLVGIEVEDEESEGAAAAENSSSFAFMDDFNRQCTLSTKQVLNLIFDPFFQLQLACNFIISWRAHNFDAWWLNLFLF